MNFSKTLKVNRNLVLGLKNDNRQFHSHQTLPGQTSTDEEVEVKDNETEEREVKSVRFEWRRGLESREW